MRRKQKQPRQPRRAFSNKLRIISTVLIVSLMFSGCSLLVRSGAAYVDGKTYRNAIQQLAIVNNNKNKAEVIPGDVYDVNAMPISISDKVHSEDGFFEYPSYYSWILGNVTLADNGVLNSNAETLYQKSPDIQANKGYSIRLTLDASLQKEIYEMVKGTRCSVVVLHRDSGRIKALVSSYEGKEFNLGTKLDSKKLKLYNASKQPVWLPSYISDAQAPGSVYKLFTSALLLENDKADFVCNDTGELIFDDGTLTNDGGAAYGEIDLETGFVLSDNIYFAEAFLQTDLASIRGMSNKLLLNNSIDTDFGTVDSYTVFKDYSDHERALTGIGQAELKLSSLSIALMTQGLLSGKIYRPYVVKAKKCYTTEKGELKDVETVREEVISRDCVSANTQIKIAGLMQAAAESYGLPRELITGAKTGTADLPDGSTRASMVCVNDDYIVVMSHINNEGLYGKSLSDKMIRTFTWLSNLER